MDIRSWLQPKKKTKKLKIEDDDDDDVIPGSPDVQIVTKKKKPSNDTHSSKTKHKDKSVKDKPLKEVKVVDLFGNGPIKRTEPIVKKPPKKTETGIHSDDEFDKSLLEIDLVEVQEAEKKEQSKKQSSNSDKLKSPKKAKHHKDSTPKKESKSHTKTKSKDKTPHKSQNEKVPAIERIEHADSKMAEDIKKEIMNKGKRKFSEFIGSDNDESQKKVKLENDTGPKKSNDDVVMVENDKNHDVTGNDSILDDHDVSMSKKRKMNKSLNKSVLTDEERHERKVQSAALYQNYLNRTGPKHLGSKEMPEGAPNCLKDCAFLLTGVLDSFERDEVVATITKYGGCVKSGISKKVTHVLAGEDAGPAKMAKAQELGIKILNEDDFLEMLKDSNKPQHKHDTYKEVKKEKVLKDDSKAKLEVKKEKVSKVDSKDKQEVKKRKHSKSRSPKKVDVKIENEVDMEDATKLSTNMNKVNDSKPSINQNENVQTNQNRDSSGTMWVEKYKPQNVKQIIGQLGEASNVNKLINWLTKWYVNRKTKTPKPSPWAKNDDGSFYKAALLSGPPGVGKTTTVTLVCKQLGFDMVEFNASDTRNKTLIKEQIGELLTTTSLSGFAKGQTGKQAITKKHVLVMDEVDGMAGNEDRGGLQELIGLIKSTSVPIICMCNDRNSQKMRSLVNYCYDLRFNRPRVEQIKAAMRSICCKENIKIPPDVLGQLIASANQDVRQTLHMLSLWAADPSRMGPDKLNKAAAVTVKDVKLGPWEAIRKVFSAEDHKKMSIMDKSDLFFYDYSLAPLFVQENYLQVQPHCPKHEILERMSRAADSIAYGDVIEKRIRSSQAWSLLPIQAMFSSVIPGHELSGHVAAQIQFPGWLGKNSRANKMHRLCQEIHAHTRLTTTGSKSSIFLDYSSHLRDAIITPLIKDKGDGVERSLQVLESYHLLREDLDSLTELSIWPGQRNPTVLIDPKVKAAMTRTYNKKAMALPYAPGAVKKGRARDDDADDDEDIEEETPDSDPENDALIKKKTKKEKDASTSDKASSSKGKSKAKAATSKGKKK